MKTAGTAWLARWLAASAAVLLAACSVCWDPDSPRLFTLTDGQVAQVTGGTGDVTDGGCQTVCRFLYASGPSPADASVVDAPPSRSMFFCELQRHALTCTPQRVCSSPG